VFWMWMVALLGMATGLVEATLAQLYKVRWPDGSFRGGPAYYIQRGRSHHPVASAVLDLTGVVCPGPIVEAKHLLGSMASGETLKLVSNCPGISSDIPEWVKATGFALLATEEVSAGKFEFYIRKP